MKMNASLTLFLIVCVASAAQAVFQSGSCYYVPSMPNFRVNRYTGSWYEIKRFNSVFERSLKCGRATYEMENANSISVEYTGVNKITGEVASLYGSAAIISSSAPNKLSITLPVQIAGVTALEHEGDYSIWDTDYDNYALVYSCKQIVTGLLKAETVWFLSRQKTMSDDVMSALAKKLKSANLDANTFEVVDQRNC